MFKNLAIDSKLHYCGCSAGAAGGDAACGDGGGGGGGDGSTDGPSAAQAAAANEPGGFAVTAAGFTTDVGTYSNNADGSVSFDSGNTSAGLGATAAPAMTAASPTNNPYTTATTPAVAGRTKGFNKGYQSALATAKEQSKAAFANPSYNIQQDDMVRNVAPIAAPTNLLTPVDKAATRTPTLFGKKSVNHPDVISQREVQAELNRRAATVGPRGPTVTEIDAVKGGIPGDRPDAELSILDRGMNIYKGVQNLKRDAAERVSKDIAGLVSGRPQEFLGYTRNPITGDMTQPTWSNVPGAHIDAMGRYNTNPDMDYAPSSGQMAGPLDSGGSEPLRPPTATTTGTPNPYSPPGTADAPLHNIAGPTYTPGVVLVGGIPHYRDVAGNLVKFAGY